MPSSDIPRSFATASVSREAAAALVEAGLAAARELGFEAAVAVTDATGTLRAFERHDGAPLLTAEVAIDKAWTASSYGYPTHVWNAYVADPKVAPLANLPRMMPVGGGHPCSTTASWWEVSASPAGTPIRTSRPPSWPCRRSASPSLHDVPRAADAAPAGFLDGPRLGSELHYRTRVASPPEPAVRNVAVGRVLERRHPPARRQRRSWVSLQAADNLRRP